MRSVWPLDGLLSVHGNEACFTTTLQFSSSCVAAALSSGLGIKLCIHSAFACRELDNKTIPEVCLPSSCLLT
jgi:hypothetical protein